MLCINIILIILIKNSNNINMIRSNSNVISISYTSMNKVTHMNNGMNYNTVSVLQTPTRP